MRRQKASTLWRITIALTAITFLACGGGDDDSDGKNDDDDGVLGTGGVLSQDGSAIQVAGKLNLSGGDSSGSALALASVSPSDLNINCVTFEQDPKAATGAIGDDGSFSLSIDAANVAFGCFILQGTNQVGSLVFEDPDEKDMSGNSQSTSQMAFTGDVDMGDVNLDLDTGKAVVKVDDSMKERLLENITSSTERFDFTGTWKAYALDTVASGYKGVCAKDADYKKCSGPKKGETFFIKRRQGWQFKPNDACKQARKNGDKISECKGDRGDKKKFAISVWRNKSAYQSCGSVSGFTTAEARSLRFDPADADKSNFSKYEWSDGFVDGWKPKDATAKWDIHDCTVKKIKGSNGKVRYAETCANVNGGSWSHIENGCHDGNGNRYEMSEEDWDIMDNGESLDPKASKNFDGYTLYRNRATIDGKTITCSHLGKQEGADGDQKILVSAGESCSALPESNKKQKVAKLKCYAEAFDEKRDEANGCLQDVRLNWDANDPADFVMDHGPSKPRDRHVQNLFRYTSPDSGTFRFEETFRDHIDSGGNDVICEVQEVVNISFTKKGPDDAIMEFVSERALAQGDEAPDPCKELTNGDTSVRQKYMFGIKRQ